MADAIEMMEARAHTVEVETFDRISERVTKWAKRELWWLGAVGVLASLLGVSWMFDFHRKVDEAMDRVLLASTQVDSVASAVRSNSERLRGETNAALGEVGGLSHNVDSLYSVVNQLGVQKLVAERGALQMRLDSANSTLGHLVSLAGVIENWQFRVFVHIPDRTSGGGVLSTVTEALEARGFLINDVNIAELRVNVSEVIYYDPDTKDKADEVAALLREYFKEIESRLVDRERRRREILIKLSP